MVSAETIESHEYLGGKVEGGDLGSLFGPGHGGSNQEVSRVTKRVLKAEARGGGHVRRETSASKPYQERGEKRDIRQGGKRPEDSGQSAKKKEEDRELIGGVSGSGRRNSWEGSACFTGGREKHQSAHPGARNTGGGPIRGQPPQGAERSLIFSAP